MNPLSVLAGLLSISSSLKNLFTKTAKFDPEQLVTEIVSKLKVIIHAEIIQDDIVNAKVSAEDLVEGIGTYNGEVSTHSAKQLVKKLDELEVRGVNIGSPLGQLHKLKLLCDETNTTGQEKQQAVSVYLLLSTLILAVLQERARQTVAQSIQVADQKGEIQEFASKHGKVAQELLRQTVTARCKEVTFWRDKGKENSTPTFGPTPPLDHTYEWGKNAIKDTWLSTTTDEAIRSETNHEEGGAYTEVNNKLMTEVLYAYLGLLKADHEAEGARTKMTKCLGVGYHGHVSYPATATWPALFTQIEAFFHWRKMAESTVASILKVSDFPLPGK